MFCKDKETSLRRLYRWYKLVMSLESTPQRLHMRGWRHNDRDCGTVPCAAGHASLDPEFQQEGFKADQFGVPYCDRIGDAPCGITESFFGLPAVEAFFGISPSQAQYICVPARYDTPHPITPAEVCKRIDEVIDDVKERPSHV